MGEATLVVVIIVIVMIVIVVVIVVIYALCYYTKCVIELFCYICAADNPKVAEKAPGTVSLSIVQEITATPDASVGVENCLTVTPSAYLTVALAIAPLTGWPVFASNALSHIV